MTETKNKIDIHEYLASPMSQEDIDAFCGGGLEDPFTGQEFMDFLKDDVFGSDAGKMHIYPNSNVAVWNVDSDYMDATITFDPNGEVGKRWMVESCYSTPWSNSDYYETGIGSEPYNENYWVGDDVYDAIMSGDVRISENK